jgi:hypothetical protein
MKFYVLRLVDWLPNAVRVVREGQSFGAAFFENISVSGRVQIHRIIICPKLYNYIYVFKTVQNILSTHFHQEWHGLIKQI